MEYRQKDPGGGESSWILYTPSAFARQHCIYLQETGELKNCGTHKSRRDLLHSFLFMAVTGGRGRLLLAGKEHGLYAGDCVFLDCTHAYSYEAVSDDFSIKWVHFYGGGSEELVRRYEKVGGAVRFRPVDFLLYDDLLSDIFRLACREEYISDLRLCSRIMELLAALAAQASGSEPKNARQDVGRVRQYLEEHYREKITLDSLAERFYSNKYHMARAFRHQYGSSIIHYLTQVRITRAKQFLRFTDMSVEQAGQACGFQDANYFCRVFRKVEGTSPGEFRRMWSACGAGEIP